MPFAYHRGVDGWIEENQFLRQQCADSIERALQSPAGLPPSCSLQEWVERYRDEEQRFARRIAYWEQRRAEASAAHEAAWQQGMKDLGLDRQRPASDLGATYEPPTGSVAQPGGPVAVIYRFYAADDSLLYIGKTVRSYEQRIKDHKRKEWFPDACRITLERVPLSEVDQREVAAIRAERPRYNIAHNQPV
jgi:hypothetical protein